MEGNIIERVRDLVGSRMVIGIKIDPPCHLTIKRMRLSDIIVLYKEFPRADVVERPDGLLILVLRTLRGEVPSVMSL